MSIKFNLPDEMYSTIVKKSHTLKNIDPSVIDDYVTALCLDYCNQYNYQGEQVSDFLGKVKGFVYGLISRKRVINPLEKSVDNPVKKPVASVYSALFIEELLDKMLTTNDNEEYMKLYSQYISKTPKKALFA